MVTTYKAILRGNQLEWSDEAPASLTSDGPVTVQVTILDDLDLLAQKQRRGQPMADILAHLASKQALNHIPDPVTWEREVRQDRPLPDRT